MDLDYRIVVGLGYAYVSGGPIHSTDLEHIIFMLNRQGFQYSHETDVDCIVCLITEEKLEELRGKEEKAKKGRKSDEGIL